MKLLKRIESPTSPFDPMPKLLSAKGKPHWVKPLLVAQVRYTEITDDGRLRHPAYLGFATTSCPKEVNGSKRSKGAKRFQGQGSRRVPKVQEKSSRRRISIRSSIS